MKTQDCKIKGLKFQLFISKRNVWLSTKHKQRKNNLICPSVRVDNLVQKEKKVCSKDFLPLVTTMVSKLFFGLVKSVGTRCKVPIHFEFVFAKGQVTQWEKEENACLQHIFFFPVHLQSSLKLLSFSS